MEQGLKVFVVEDNEWYNKLITHTVNMDPEFEVRSFMNGMEALNAMDEIPDVVTLDYRLPDCSGEDLLKKMLSRLPEVKVIVISEQQNIEVAVNMLKMGAYDYLVKSENLKDQLLNKLHQINKNKGLENQISNLKKEVRKKYSFEDSIIGNSPVMMEVLELVEKAVKIDMSVSIFGETGTGKEVIAKAIHYNSPSRSQHPFVAVNVAAIPEDLIESELFGHEKGAFTGANRTRKGKFEEANGGTLLLDEIGEMDLLMQKKMLRVLQEREVTRIGSNQAIKINCRIITATHKDLAKEVAQGRFRQDLFYRLKGLPIELPPLRERGNDSVLLARHFIKEFMHQHGTDGIKLTDSAVQKLQRYSWPGNVRELRASMELAVAMASDGEITEHDLHLNDQLPEESDLLNQASSLREINQRVVKHYLNRFGGDKQKVADALDIGLTTVYRLLKEQSNP